MDTRVPFCFATCCRPAKIVLSSAHRSSRDKDPECCRSSDRTIESTQVVPKACPPSTRSHQSNGELVGGFLAIQNGAGRRLQFDSQSSGRG
jgi:hypothetical protein